MSFINLNQDQLILEENIDKNEEDIIYKRNNNTLESQSFISLIIATLYLPIEETTFVNLDYNFDSLSYESIAYGLKVIIEKFHCKWMGIPHKEQENKDENNLFIPLSSQILNKEFIKNLNSLLLRKRRVFNSYPGEFFEATKIEFDCFDRINELFANQIEEKLLINKNTVLILDFALMLVAQKIKTRNPNLYFPIGFHLFEPFPCFDLLRIYPFSSKLLHSLLFYDFISFESGIFVTNFSESLIRTFGDQIKVYPNAIEFEGRIIVLKVQPHGILCDYWTKLATHESVLKASSNQDNGLIKIISICKFDIISTEIKSNLKAIEKYFLQNESMREKVQFIMVILPNGQESRRIMEEVEIKISDINGTYATLDWPHPIYYIFKKLTMKERCILYTRASIGMFLPLRETNYNYVEEYIETKSNNIENTGSLILSHLPGNNLIFPDANLIHPYSSNSIVEAINTAILADKEELFKKMKLLKQANKKYDLITWIKNLNEELVMRKDKDRFQAQVQIEKYFSEAGKTIFELKEELVILIEYEDILNVETHEYKLKDILSRLSVLESVHVIIVTSESLEKIIGNIPNKHITCIASNGDQIRLSNDLEIKANTYTSVPDSSIAITFVLKHMFGKIWSTKTKIIGFGSTGHRVEHFYRMLQGLGNGKSFRLNHDSISSSDYSLPDLKAIEDILEGAYYYLKNKKIVKLESAISYCTPAGA